MKFAIIITATLILFSVPSGESSAKTKDAAQSDTLYLKEKNYALLVSTEDHINIAIATAQELINTSSQNIVKFEIVICGKAVEFLKNQSPLQSKIENGISNGIEFSACAISLNKAKIRPEEVIKGIHIVPNGLLRIFDLQEIGYRTIEL